MSGPGEDAASEGGFGPIDPEVEQAYLRPDGVDGSFAPVAPEPPYTAPPPTVSPEERANFGRPPGAAEFDAPPADRLPPRHGVAGPPLPPWAEDSFGRPASGADGFAPAPGTRIAPSGATPESPWWKPDAARDPWRDPESASWLGRPAVLAAGQLEQVDPDADVEQQEFEPPTDEDDADAAEDAGSRSRRNVRIGRFGISTLALGLVVALVAGAIGGVAGYFLAGRANSVLHNRDVSLATVDKPVSRPADSIAGIAQRLGPAIVSISFHTSSEAGVGSGVVIDSDGDILTNNHVVAPADTAKATLYVTFTDNRTATAKIVGRDPVTDLAVIKVSTDKLTVAPLGDSSKIAVGDPVIAIGSPLGLDNTVTSGIISALHRPVSIPLEDGTGNSTYDAIQTDAAINPGNSGGALVDSAGAVIGINSAIASVPSTSSGQSGSLGIGFAIPINEARTIATELIKTGQALHASIGINASDVTDGSARQGAYIKQIVPGGPADHAGLKAGDVVTLADTTLISSAADLSVFTLQHNPGDVVTIHYYRNGAESDVSVTLGSG
jgi:S1-C subfamily serine protease